MATINYSVPISSYNINDWNGFGIYTVANTSQLRFTDARHNVDYTGNFTYSGNTLTGGTVNSITWSQMGKTYLTLSDINEDLASWEAAANNGQSAALGPNVFAGDDNYIGSSGNDDFYTYLGNDTYDGGTGLDTVHYAYLSADGGGFTATPSGNGFTVQGAGKTDTLVNVERVDFGDGSTLALDVKAGEHTGSAYRLYEAAFGRTPDTAGLNYWVKNLDAGASLQQVAKGFVDSAEFKTLNPGNTQQAIINNFYLNVLHRDADSAGSQYWNAAMNNGMSASDVLVSFSESAENINNTAAELNNGVWLV